MMCVCSIQHIFIWVSTWIKKLQPNITALNDVTTFPTLHLFSHSIAVYKFFWLKTRPLNAPSLVLIIMESYSAKYA